MKRARGRLGRAQAGGRPASGRKRKTRLQGGSARHCRGLWATGNPRVQGPTMQTQGVRLRLSKECRRCNAAGKYSNISEESTPQTRRARSKAPFPARPEAQGISKGASPPEREPHPHGYHSRQGAFFPRIVAPRRRAFRVQVSAPRRIPPAGAASTCHLSSRANECLSGSPTR